MVKLIPLAFGWAVSILIAAAVYRTGCYITHYSFDITIHRVIMGVITAVFLLIWLLKTKKRSTMISANTINVKDIINSPLAITLNEGKAVGDKALPLIREGHKVTLDFDGTKSMSTMFLLKAVKTMMEGTSPEEVNALLEFSNLTKGYPTDHLMALVTEYCTNKEYYSPCTEALFYEKLEKKQTTYPTITEGGML